MILWTSKYNMEKLPIILTVNFALILANTSEKTSFAEHNFLNMTLKDFIFNHTE